ncbi:hypothetical protein B0H16DRAFT_1522228 [Mycena metata]|uniref:Uncharacterized protein n=1 Tax=Mycena metata TaxID=1033252 RepID=A0AAD7JKA0_9AGAR|nr:hypothetical protein B0H16DRAFT_1522228 [Mycena metata]
MALFALWLSVIALSSIAAADSETSVIVPFADPQPISADILGVDGQGRTTWQLHQGAFTGTWTDPQGSFPGTATLVEGADYASYTYSVSDPEGFVLGGECSIGAGVAVCVAAESGQDGAATATETDSVTAFGLQIAATAVPTSPPSGSSASAKNSGSTSGASPPSNTQPSSSVRTSASNICTLAGLLLAYYLL